MRPGVRYFIIRDREDREDLGGSRRFLMDRRSFLAATAGSLALSSTAAARGLPSPLNLPGQRGLRLSITWGMLGRMPAPKALALFFYKQKTAYEMFDWRDPKALDTFVSL